MTWQLGAALFVGALTWSLLEYLIHRWLGHGSRARRNPFGVEHVRHHIEGNYFAPAWKKLTAVALVAVLVGIPATLLAGRIGAAYAIGLLGFYVVYETLHRLEHVWEGISPYGRWARRHHFTHHFSDARVNFGVTSPLWDFVFRTYQAPTLIVVPRKLSMDWLLDPATGKMLPQFAQTYVLAKSSDGAR
ncbi:MAG: sterol desaturase family protein [Sandaracinaceae bacterium]|jgi:sterol desaturase/sphingolipid hydroxylase (fatty acid hydroxylase superfamily)|nr:sterol desaturase family protein [Sandaracinaceae bacterium]